MITVLNGKMSNKQIKPIEPRWYNTLEFLTMLINEEETVEMIQEISKEYCLAKENYNFFHFRKPFEIDNYRMAVDKKVRGKRGIQLLQESLTISQRIGIEDLFSSSEEINLFYPLFEDINFSYKIACIKNLPKHKLVVLLQEEMDFLVSADYFWLLDGQVQTYIFHQLSSDIKKELTHTILYNPWSDEKPLNYSPNEGFKFDLEGVQIIIKHLSEQPEYYFDLSDLTKNNSWVSGKLLAEYMKHQQVFSDIWWDYLNSSKPNRFYAAEILVKLMDNRIVEPLLNFLKTDFNVGKNVSSFIYDDENKSWKLDPKGKIIEALVEIKKCQPKQN